MPKNKLELAPFHTIEECPKCGWETIAVRFFQATSQNEEHLIPFCGHCGHDFPPQHPKDYIGESNG